MSKGEPKITRQGLLELIEWLEDKVSVQGRIINHLCDAHHNPRAVTQIVPNMQRELRALDTNRPELFPKDMGTGPSSESLHGEPWHFQETT
jgi:hypothetical protein